MLSRLDYLIWFAVILLEVGVVALVFWRRLFQQYSLLVLEMLASATAGGAQYLCLRSFGFTSSQYRSYCYYFETVLCVLMYFLIIQLYERAFEEINATRQIRWAAAFLLLLTAGFSAVVVNNGHLLATGGFVFELEQNLNFVGVVLIYGLWGGVMKMKKTRTRLAQIVLALGIYFSAITVTFALCNLFPVIRLPVLRWTPPLLALWLPLAWTYAFMKAPEEKKLRIEGQLEPKVLPAWQEVTVR